MSIYSTNRGGWQELNDVVQSVPRAQPAGAPQPKGDTTDWTTSFSSCHPPRFVL